MNNYNHSTDSSTFYKQSTSNAGLAFSDTVVPTASSNICRNSVIISSYIIPLHNIEAETVEEKSQKTK